MSNSSVTQGAVPPQDKDAEKAVLGALLLDPEAFYRISFLTPVHFYLPQHKVIYEAIRDIINDGGRPDIIVLTEQLRKKELLDNVGGRSYIADLSSLVPSAANIEYYANIVLNTSIKRSLIGISSEVHALCFQAGADASDILDEAQQKFFALTESGQKATYFRAKDVLTSVLAKIEERTRDPNRLTGIPSGFKSLDFLTNGFQNSDLIIIGARPSIGKTALALSMFSHITVHEEIPAAFFSLEQPREQICERLLSLEANVALNSIRSGHITSPELSRLSDALTKIYEREGSCLVDVSNMKLLDLKAVARQLVRVEKVKIIFIDYLGLIKLDRANAHMEVHEMMAEISRELKGLARELNIPIVALSQLSREAEGKAPTLANIRGSGAIEQDADLVMFLNRPREADSKDEGSEGIETDLSLSKHRNGATGTIKLVFKGSFVKFAEKE